MGGSGADPGDVVVLSHVEPDGLVDTLRRQAAEGGAIPGGLANAMVFNRTADLDHRLRSAEELIEDLRRLLRERDAQIFRLVLEKEGLEAQLKERG